MTLCQTTLASFSLMLRGQRATGVLFRAPSPTTLGLLGGGREWVSQAVLGGGEFRPIAEYIVDMMLIAKVSDGFEEHFHMIWVDHADNGRDEFCVAR